LPLELQLQAPAVFDTFVAGPQGAMLAHLLAAATGQGAQLIYLSGPAGTGKTHLLQAACRAADDCGKRAMYLNLGLADEMAPVLLEGLGQMELLALDGLETVAGKPAWERELFAVLDDFHLGEGVLLLAARSHPAVLRLELPDLASRIAAAVLYRLQPLQDEAMLDALLLHAGFRGLEFDSATAQYLLSRVRRGMTELCACLDRLDRISLIEQRKVTIPFIREALRGAFAE
jgi:DnaA family protein